MAKNNNEIKNDLISSLLTNEPNADVQDGSLIRDINIDPQAVQMSFLYDENDYTKKIVAWKKYAEELENDDLINIANNLGIERKPAQFAKTIITFRAKNKPTQRIRIGNEDGTGGISIKSMDLEDETYYQFNTTETVYLETEPYFNESTGYYEISASAKAALAGTESNVGVGTLIILESPISGIDSVYNYVAATGGKEEENNVELAERMSTAIKGSTKNTENGIKDILNQLDNIKEIKIFNPNSEEPSEIGYAYAYIKSDSETLYKDTFIYNSIYNYYKLFKRPVKRIISVKAYYNGQIKTLTENIDYYLYKDNKSIFKNSIDSNDAIVFSYENTPDNNSQVTVDYIYNDKIEEAQNLISLKQNEILILGNVIVKQATPVLIDITLDIKLKFGYNSEEYKNNIITGIQNYINGFKMGEDLSTNDLYSYIIKNFDYIESINYPFSEFKIRNEQNTEKIEVTYGEYITVDENSIKINFN